MELSTILQILYANDMTEVVALAVKLDNNIESVEKYPVGSYVSQSCDNEQIKHLNIKFKGKTSGKFAVEIVGINKYSFKERYLVKLPDGSHKWTSDYWFEESISEVESINSELVID